MLRQNSNIFLALIVFFDLLILIFAYLLSRYIVFSDFSLTTWNLQKIIVTLFLIFILFITLEKFEFSTPYRFRSYFVILKSIFAYELILIASFYFCILFKLYNFNNEFVFYYVIITFMIFLSERFLIKMFLDIIRMRGFNYKRYLIVGAGMVGINFYKKIKSSHDLGIKIEGFLDDNKDLVNTTISDYTQEIKDLILGTTEIIETILKSKLIDNVVIALPMKAEDKIIELTNACEKYEDKAELIPDYYKIVTTTPSINQIKGFPLIGIRNVPLENMFNRFIKRLFDLGFALIGLLLCFPLFLLVVFGIKITSRGPVFFRQKRTGYKQKEFYIIKFRTMRVNNDSDKVQATKDDPRKTKFGDFLRRTNIDEIPQLINILIGDMSLIGPRPHMIAHTEEFYQKYDKYLVRHWVKPGLTGWAQVNGWRGDSDIAMRVKYDIDYIENWSLWFDFKIIVLTFFGRKVRKNAV